MYIEATKKEILNILHTALCDAEGTSYMRGYGLTLCWNKEEYKKSKESIKKSKEICYEDVLVQMIADGYSLTYKDVEGDGENSSDINLEDLLERFKLVPISTIGRFVDETSDASDADCFLQTIFWKSVIFG